MEFDKPFKRERDDRKPREDRDNRGSGERKAYDPDRKPYDPDRKPRDFNGERKPFDPNRKPYDPDRKPRDFNGERKPYDPDRKPREYNGERKPFDPDRKPREFGGERKAFDPDRKPREFNKEFRDRNEERPNRDNFRSNMGAISEILIIDNDLINLVSKRSRLLNKLKKGEMIKSGDEKTIRLAWEEVANGVSHDPKFVKSLFLLLQEIAISDETKQHFFQLAPNYNKIDIDMPPVLDSRAARMYLALAAASGATTKLNALELADPLMDLVKLFNQVGAELWWEENGDVLSRGGKGLSNNLDKVLFVGQDDFNFALIVAFNLFRNSKFKIIGDGKLRSLDLSALRRSLISCGARLTSATRGQEGLPVRLECSAILPNEFRFSADLDADYVLAIILSSVFWHKNGLVSFDLSQSPHKDSVLTELSPILKNCNIAHQELEGKFIIQCGRPSLAEEINIELKPDLAAYCLAIPYFTGGELRIKANWASQNYFNQQVESIFASRGLELSVGANKVSAKRAEDYKQEREALDINSYPQELQPLVLVFNLLPILKDEKQVLELAKYSPIGQKEFLEDFLNQIGLSVNELGEFSKIDKSKTPLYCPNPYWCMALSLISFVVPYLRLANPNIMHELSPKFWTLFNGLPRPDFSPKPKKKKEEENDDDNDGQKPIFKRRYITNGDEPVGRRDDPNSISYSEYD